MATKPRKVVAVEPEGTRIWNVSGKLQQIAGVNVAPGRAVMVDSKMASSKMMLKAQEDGMVFIGAVLPEQFRKENGMMIRAKMPEGHVRSHG